MRAIRSFITFLRNADKSNVELKTKLNIAIELRDNIETLCSGVNYVTALPKLWPIFKQVLQGEPAFSSTSLEHVSTLGYILFTED